MPFNLCLPRQGHVPNRWITRSPRSPSRVKLWVRSRKTTRRCLQPVCSSSSVSSCLTGNKLIVLSGDTALTTKSLAATSLRQSQQTFSVLTTITTSKILTSFPVSYTNAFSRKVRCFQLSSSNLSQCWWGYLKVVQRMDLRLAFLDLELLWGNSSTRGIWQSCSSGSWRSTPRSTLSSYPVRLHSHSISCLLSWWIVTWNRTVGEKDEITIKQVAEAIVKSVGFQGEVTVRFPPFHNPTRAQWIRADCRFHEET